MNRMFWMLAAAGLAVCVQAVTLQANKPLPGPYASQADAPQSFVVEAAQLEASSTAIFSAVLAFTLPSETPAYDSAVKQSKLAIVADTTGELLVADAETQGWKRSGYVAAANVPVNVRAVGRLASGTLTFTVTFSAEGTEPKTLTVRAPASGAGFSALTFEGEGTAQDITLARVSESILPSEENGTQNEAAVAHYVAWLNDAQKGGAFAADASGELLQNAFAMNAGAAPALAITAFDPVSGLLTVKGLAGADGAQTALDLKKIYGTLTLITAQTLGGEQTVTRVNIASGADDAQLVRVPVPEDARFIKASVSVTPPPSGAPVAEGTPVTE